MSTHRFSAILLPAPEIEGFVAQCVEMDVASQGGTMEAALENLREALSLHLEGLEVEEFPPTGLAMVAQLDVALPAAK